MNSLQSAVAAAPANHRPAGGVLVSFIIPAWNEQSMLADCLASIERLYLPDGIEIHEIIVVDNESTDDTAAVAVAGGASVVTVAPGRPSRARNAGAAVATGQLLAFIDADCELDADWLAVCAEHLRSGKVVAAGTSLAAPDPDATWIEMAWFEIVGERGEAAARNVSWLPSFNILVRRDAFVRAGTFDETLETCEDCELGYRLESIGTLICDSRAATIHHGESKSLQELIRREAWRGRGNIALLCRDGINLREGRAVVIPLLFLLGLILCALGAIISLPRPGALIPWLIALGGTLLIPVGILALKRVIPRGPVQSLQCVLVYGSYLVGRAIGLMMPIRRIQRRAGSMAAGGTRQAVLPRA